MKPIELLKEAPIFGGLSDASLEALAARAQVTRFDPGEPIIRFGKPGEVFGLVLSGEVEATRARAGGGKETLGRFGESEFFGEMSLLTGEPTSAEVVALAPSEVLEIPHEALSDVLVREPGFAKDLALAITRRMLARERSREEQERIEEARKAQEDPYGVEGFPLPRGGRALTLNCGSSSLKYRLFDSGDPAGGGAGLVERIGLSGTRHRFRRGNERGEEAVAGAGHEAAIEVMVAALGGAQGLSGIDVVGHRVVHGGEKYGQAVVIDEDVMEAIRAFESLAPLHVPANLAGIEAARRLLPDTPQVAVFDTSFYRTLPRFAYLYGLPYERYTDDGIRRYGFHGTSHKFVSYKAATFLKRPWTELQLVTCHLGNGASVTAIDHGRPVDTSMGMTPLEGLIMGTRVGDLDPGALLHLMRIRGMAVEEAEAMLNRESGLKGLSGVSSDMREVLEQAHGGNDRALMAVQSFCYRIKKYVGAYWAALGGLDALVFTGGIGENSPEVRARVCQGLASMGVVLDEEKNRAPRAEAGAADVATDESPVRILVVETDEERMIAREAGRALARQHMTEVMRHRDQPIPIGVSAHHVHLSREHVALLFGEGRTLTFKAPLSQPGQFAAEERVRLIGPKGRVERVRVLGPERPQSQVEISRTEEFKLGIDAPIRLSGDLQGTPGIVLEGPAGTVALEQGVICAMRHIHMTPRDALGFGVRDRDVVMVRVEGERSLIFGDVVVRVKPDFRLELHVDTDEANAAELNTGMVARLHAIQSRR
ncbi:MAG: acetate/propionate family kinase [Planctomycetota bacterium]